MSDTAVLSSSVLSEEAREGLAGRLAQVRQNVADAARSAGRDPSEVTTIVVTKFQPVELVHALVQLGVRDVGENRAQEAAAKASSLAETSQAAAVRWHFIGQLQTNKAKQVRTFASAVHSVDRAALVAALSRAGAAGENIVASGAATDPLDCFIELALTDEPGRGGLAPDDMLDLAERVLAAPGLRLRGVMAVAPLNDDARRAFARVREASERLRSLAPDATAISAGMSGDYVDAIAEGATHLRIGTAITGKRPERA
ncbi:YggS family pyridoxal phosphate-dependent enzyme [Humibacter antri]